MKTINDWKNMWDVDRDNAMAYRRSMAKAVERLETLYKALQDVGPRETAAAWLAVDPESVRVVLATMVNQMQHDGRICRDVKSWASMQDDSWDRETAHMMGIYTNIHPANLNQIALYTASRLMDM